MFIANKVGGGRTDGGTREGWLAIFMEEGVWVRGGEYVRGCQRGVQATSRKTRGNERSSGGACNDN